MNETKESPSNDRAIASGTQVFLCCLVGERVGRVKTLSYE